MARQGRETLLFTTSLARHGHRITANYVQQQLKAARFSIRDQYVTHYPYEGDYYEATIHVYEVLPGYQIVCLNGVPIISNVEG